MRGLAVVALGVLWGGGAGSAGQPGPDIQASLEICAQSAGVSDAARDRLAALGWQALGTDPARQARFAALLADGVAAVSAERLTSPAEWEAALARATGLAALLLARPPTVPLALFLGPSQGAAFAMIEAPETPARLRCYFAGPGDADVARLIEVMAAMDRDRDGAGGFSPFLRAVTVNRHATSTRMVLFGDSAAELVGRAPLVGLGVSWFRPLQ